MELSCTWYDEDNTPVGSDSWPVGNNIRRVAVTVSGLRTDIDLGIHTHRLTPPDEQFTVTPQGTPTNPRAHLQTQHAVDTGGLLGDQVTVAHLLAHLHGKFTGDKAHYHREP